MGFFFIAFVLTIISWIFSILNWRLKQPVFFWIALVSTSLLLLFFLINIELFIFWLSDISFFVMGVFMLCLIGIPLYFIISSKVSTSKPESDITDDYLNQIINSEEKNITDDDLNDIINSEEKEIDYE